VKRVREAVPVILDVFGFAAITVGASLMWVPAGWIVAGAALIALGWRISD
jgi:hypothetical protein